ncbi:MAG: hypothetical protein K2Y40_21175 [Reyranella sp.]|nr:hypothetical protein [Reyranella sp.]
MKGMLRRGVAGAAGAAMIVFAVPAVAQQEAWKVGSAAQPGSALLTIVEDNIANWNKVPGVKIERQFVASEQELAQQERL